MWKSISSNSWEYFGCVRGLGFESYVCYLCAIVLLLIFNNMYEYGISIVSLSWLKCITDMNWLNWLCTWMVTKWSCVQTWLAMKYELYFLKSVVLERIWEGKRKPRREAKRGLTFRSRKGFDIECELSFGCASGWSKKGIVNQGGAEPNSRIIELLVWFWYMYFVSFVVNMIELESVWVSIDWSKFCMWSYVQVIVIWEWLVSCMVGIMFDSLIWRWCYGFNSKFFEDQLS